MAEEGSPADQPISCHAGALTDPDLGTVEALARLQLTFRRCGVTLRLCHVPPALAELLDLLGLADVLTCRLGLQPCGKAEEREEMGGVQEGVHGRDLPP